MAEMRRAAILEPSHRPERIPNQEGLQAAIRLVVDQTWALNCWLDWAPFYCAMAVLNCTGLPQPLCTASLIIPRFCSLITHSPFRTQYHARTASSTESLLSTRLIYSSLFLQLCNLLLSILVSSFSTPELSKPVPSFDAIFPPSSALGLHR